MSRLRSRSFARGAKTMPPSVCPRNDMLLALGRQFLLRDEPGRSGLRRGISGASGIGGMEASQDRGASRRIRNRAGVRWRDVGLCNYSLQHASRVTGSNPVASTPGGVATGMARCAPASSGAQTANRSRTPCEPVAGSAPISRRSGAPVRYFSGESLRGSLPAIAFPVSSGHRQSAWSVDERGIAWDPMCAEEQLYRMLRHPGAPAAEG